MNGPPYKVRASCGHIVEVSGDLCAASEAPCRPGCNGAEDSTRPLVFAPGSTRLFPYQGPPMKYDLKPFFIVTKAVR
mgnify:CR=1 FL=1